MGMRLKDIIRLVAPTGLVHLATRLCDYLSTDIYGLSGDYRCWDEGRGPVQDMIEILFLKRPRQHY